MSGIDLNSEENGAAAALFDALYLEHHRPLYAYLHGKAGCGETAADLLQETFIRVWRHIGEARQVPLERRRFWLFALARSAAYDHSRRHATRKNLEYPLPSSEVAQTDPGSNPEEVFNVGEVKAALRAAIRRLPENLRIALTMQAVGGMTSSEIGETLGIPAGTVRFRISIARKRLAADPGLIAATEEKER